MDLLHLLLAFVPVFSLAFNVLSHLLLSRTGIMGGLKALVAAFAAGGVFALFLSLFLCSFTGSDDYIGEALLALISYAALGYGYFHFFNLGETGRRVRLMREIDNAGEKGLSMEELLENYSAESIISVRLNRLLNNGQLYLKDGRYFAKESSTMGGISRVIILFKVLLLGKKSEHQ